MPRPHPTLSRKKDKIEKGQDCSYVIDILLLL